MVSRFVPWALVALCFTLGVASPSITDSFCIFVPSLHLIASTGYRHAYLVLGLFTASFLVLLAMLPWRRIEAGAPGIVPPRIAHPGGGPGPTVREAMGEWPFWALGLAFMGTSLGIFSMAPQFMAYLTERGVDGAYAA